MSSGPLSNAAGFAALVHGSSPLWACWKVCFHQTKNKNASVELLLLVAHVFQADCTSSGPTWAGCTSADPIRAGCTSVSRSLLVPAFGIEIEIRISKWFIQDQCTFACFLKHQGTVVHLLKLFPLKLLVLMLLQRQSILDGLKPPLRSCFHKGDQLVFVIPSLF